MTPLGAVMTPLGAVMTPLGAVMTPPGAGMAFEEGPWTVVRQVGATTQVGRPTAPTMVTAHGPYKRDDLRPYKRDDLRPYKRDGLRPYKRGGPRPLKRHPGPRVKARGKLDPGSRGRGPGPRRFQHQVRNPVWETCRIPARDDGQAVRDNRARRSRSRGWTVVAASSRAVSGGVSEPSSVMTAVMQSSGVVSK